MNTRKAKLLKRLISEATDERSIQKKFSRDQKPFRLRRKKTTSEMQEHDDEKESEAIDTPSYARVIDKLNLMRSGKSVKDKEVSAQVKKYFNSLSGPERTALFAYLDALTEIMSGGEDASKVEDPSEDPYFLTIDRKGGGAKKQQKKQKPSGKKKSPEVDKAKGAAIVVGQ
ncbi:MAG: hypothetical protein CMA72_06990 [Euryarchaeota archaeon]|nr:hypothetical protein [Euryarchaeota archaeon]|tara:strand:+ start:26699 stop:27211 length:513 start_codon:yes stop_codon:yes gene_type:complete